jgi:hypothetical protein
MGHRALVADARQNRRGAATDGFEVWYSHWGAHAFALIDTLASGQSSGSESRGSNSDLHPTARLGRASDVGAFATEFVDPTLHEAAFVVVPDCTVTAYLPLAAAVGPGSPNAGGVLVELRDTPHPAVDARAIGAWARENRPSNRHAARSGSPTTPVVALDRFHDAVAAAFPDRELHRIPPSNTGSRPRARRSQTTGD